MNKLKLNLEDLAVETFATTPEAQQGSGTVFGQNHCTCHTQCTCPGCPTCDASCNGTCGATCDVSCNGTCYATCAGGNTCADTCYYSCNGYCNSYDLSCYGTCFEFTCTNPL